MKKSRVVLFLVLLAVHGAGLSQAQGTKADYERAEQFLRGRSRTAPRLRFQWNDSGDAFWYRKTRRGGGVDFIRVDARSGERQPAFDSVLVSKALAGQPGIANPSGTAVVEAIALNDDPAVVDLKVGDKWYRYRTGDESVVAIEPAQTQSRHAEATRLRASTRTGEESELTFLNKTEGEVALFWHDPDGQRLPYGKIAPGEVFAQHTFGGHVWSVVDTEGRELTRVEASDTPSRVIIDGRRATATPASGERPRRRTRGGATSPDGRFTCTIRDHNVLLRNTESGEETQLSTSGSADDPFAPNFHWSPDSKYLVCLQIRPAQKHTVSFVESSPRDQVQPKLHQFDYLKPGDVIERPRPRLFDIEAKTQIPVDESLFTNPWSITDLRWDGDSRRFTFLYNQRGHQVLRIVGVDAKTGTATPIVNEESRTFVDYAHKTFSRWIESTNELIWMSERDGWNHLWLYDTATGHVKNQITKGPWVVRQVESVDEDKRQIWFFAGGVRHEQDPYYLHLCRVGFDGTGMVVLTEGDGTHTVEFSPSRRYFLDTWSRVDQRPVTELRSADDGHLICKVEEPDNSNPDDPPAVERFLAKGRDGTTDIYGVIYRPSNFDPAKKYPVIEQIYAGPQGAFVPKAWAPGGGMQALAELGFIVVQIDGMGTNWRSKAFHDVCWKNLADAGFPDRIAWMQSAAKTRPWMDLERVGIYGGSAGGQNALRGLLDYADFYKAGAADCGCHDNRMDKIWWNELWMGWPVGPEYAASSNVVDAHKLRGKLLLIVGELDRNVDPASTMQVVNALIKADRDFELLVVPGANHGAGGAPYGRRRQWDFFVRHLWGAEPRRAD